MNFESCNPPVVDPLFLDILQKLMTGKSLQLEQPLSLPLKPVPIRPSSPPQMTSIPPMTSSFSSSPPNVTVASPACFKREFSSRSPFQPVSTSRPYTPHIFNSTAYSNDNVTYSHDVITPSRDVITHSRDFLTPSSSPSSSPELPRKATRTTPSPRSTPYTKQKKRIADRQAISDHQCVILKDWFARYTYLSIKNRTVVSGETGLPEKTVMYWFQNQRRRVKRSTAK